jgi:diguanylate cyclase (GGDEF)-like protein/PAS domain S-box-containing protein
VADEIASSSREWYRALAESSRDIVLVRDVDGVLSYCSPTVWTSLGYRPEELEGTHERELLHPADWVARDRLIAALVHTKVDQAPAELRFRSRNGSWRWFETVVTNCLDDAAAPGIVTNARDISERKAVEVEPAGPVLHDSLTGLPNQRLLANRLSIALSRAARSNGMVAVLTCDLDEFFVVNAMVGRDGGDRVLVEVAHRLGHALRDVDTIARMGGDEFVVVCEGLRTVDDATTIANSIRDAIEPAMVIDAVEVPVSVSIGIVTVSGYEARDVDPIVLLCNADSAMCRAKRGGKSRWALFDGSLVTATTQMPRPDVELQRALMNDELMLHYQPIYDLDYDTIVGVEALVRWNNPTRGLLQADEFIGRAEETGFIVDLGQWVLEQSCAQMAQWERELQWFGWMSVNLSAGQLAQPGLAGEIAHVLMASQLSADRLRVELTETTLLRAGDAAVVELNAIRSLGIRVGMDDFGTGDASLANLQQLPIDFLKIDRSFVNALTGRSDERSPANALVTAISQIGDTFHLQTIAEGIETDEQAQLLRDFGCPYGQGFQLARPTSAIETARRLTTQGRLFPSGDSLHSSAGSTFGDRPFAA